MTGEFPTGLLGSNMLGHESADVQSHRQHYYHEANLAEGARVLLETKRAYSSAVIQGSSFNSSRHVIV